jgi:hypothetical protein
MKPKAKARPRSRAWLGFIIALLLGAAGWLTASLVDGRIEAWDGPVYFWVYLVFLLTTGVLGYLWPAHVWRWPLALITGQAVAFGFHNPTQIPLPPTLLYLALISTPLLLPALAGVRLHHWRNPEPKPDAQK